MYLIKTKGLRNRNCTKTRQTYKKAEEQIFKQDWLNYYYKKKCKLFLLIQNALLITKVILPELIEEKFDAFGKL